jgi:Rrf2 family nitric oxide-sensitive transcriptional repressor
MYCAAHTGRLVTIDEIARFYSISNNHLMKVVHALSLAGFLTTIRGRNGGISLQRPAKDIRIDEIVKSTELDFRLVECFDATTNQCVLSPNCKLQHVFSAALQAYMHALSQATLADIVGVAETTLPMMTIKQIT